MKINYKNTALKLLDKWDEPVNIADPATYMSEEDKRVFGHDLLETLPTMRPVFAKEIRYVSVPFIEAFVRAFEKLKPLCYKEALEEYGTLIWGAAPFTLTMFYYLRSYFDDSGKWQVDYSITVFSKHSKNDFKCLDVCLSRKTGVGKKRFLWKGHAEEGRDEAYWVRFLLSFLLFVRHAEVETKIIKPEKKDWHVGTKYVNETKSEIEILDSTWFTNIVRTEGFNVRGHFRFQPCGEGRSNRKLVWISDFEKHGYIRRAKKLQE